MSDTNRAALLTLLVASYDDLRSRLARRAGSTELADEALQDTFLRLSNATGVGPVRDLKAYLFRVALSVISNRRVAERRRRTVSEAESLFEMIDDKPGPDRVIEARSEIGALKRVIQELPARRREIFMATFVDELPPREIAARLGISVRTVQVELKQALVHCAMRLNRDTQPQRALRPLTDLYRQDRARRVPHWRSALASEECRGMAAPDDPL
jgi:RNA polymerase sigma factor (sigma-70 family)